MGLVIDACVLKSASMAGKPLPSACRTVLEEVKSSSIIVSACPVLLQEWRKHRSGYSVKWMVSMYSRRLVKKVDKFSGKALSIDSAISKLDDPGKSVAAKDSHLLKLAIDGDMRVVSSEVACRDFFSVASEHCKEIGSVVWIDPSEGGEVSPSRVAIGLEPSPKEWFLRFRKKTRKVVFDSPKTQRRTVRHRLDN